MTLCLVASTADAACNFLNDEIVNPFEPGCGDVILTYTANNNTGSNVALGYPVPIPVASLTPVDGFRTYDSLFQRHQSLLGLHDEVAGAVVGQSVAGRDIWAYVVSDLDTRTSDGFAEGAVLVNGGIHAREWQTPEAATGLIETLAEGKLDASILQYLVENLTTIVVPVNNVDGFLTTQLYPASVTADREQPREGRMRRKNLRNPVTLGAIDTDITTVADNFWGIDLNRNSAQGFGLFGRSSLSQTSLIFRGPTPDTEPEVLALRAAAQLGPEARLRLFSDTHSFGQVYLAPTTPNTRRNGITQALAARMRAASGRTYQYSADPQGSPGIGTTADHFAFTYQVPAWTLELEPINGGQDYGGLATHGHSGFILPDSQVARMRTDVARQYVVGFYRQSGPPLALGAQIRDTQTDEIVYDAQWQASGASARTLSVATNRALVPGRQYRLWVAFNKPMRIRNAGGAVVPFQGQSTGAELGTLSLELPSLTGQDVSIPGTAGWLDTVGGAPGGYRRYRDDAFAVTFTIPASLTVAGPTPAVISLAVRDLAQMQLDANPATAADWASGHWVRYEDARNVDGDLGGSDCSFKPFVAMQADAVPPATTATCRAAAPPPPPPRPPPPPSGGGGGGGGSIGWLALACALALLLTKATCYRAGHEMGPGRRRTPARRHLNRPAAA